ncbi:hypothetical protein B0H14DRAFT_3479997 [Mycena olivaceomarginata]|nr:hypothetical protein B0H14DRAFT_3479997 [Mycena olivaceomarginata]
MSGAAASATSGRDFNAVPTDFGVLELKNVIEGVGGDRRWLDNQISGLQRLIVRLTSRRAELDGFIHNHYDPISNVRRLTSETLTEIFRCLDSDILTRLTDPCYQSCRFAADGEP